MMHPKRISISISATATKVLAAVIFLLLMGGVTAHAQNQQKKMDAVTEDTIPLFRGMTVGVDIIGPVQLMVSDYGQYEASLRINLKDKYYPIFELGYGKADASDESTRINYKTSAPYFRIGVDWNLLKNKHDIYRLFGGFRYGFTSFKYDVSAPPAAKLLMVQKMYQPTSNGWKACSEWMPRYGVPSVWAGVSATSAS